MVTLENMEFDWVKYWQMTSVWPNSSPPKFYTICMIHSRVLSEAEVILTALMTPRILYGWLLLGGMM